MKEQARIKLYLHINIYYILHEQWLNNMYKILRYENN